MAGVRGVRGVVNAARPLLPGTLHHPAACDAAAPSTPTLTPQHAKPPPAALRGIMPPLPLHRYYNSPATPYYQAANRLEAALDAYMAARLVFDEP